MSKIANFIIAHKHPEQLLRLVNQFDARLFHNFVHVDGRRPGSEFMALQALPHVTLVEPRRKLNWAGYGFVQVTLEAMETVLAHKTAFSYINVMSGQDYAIRPTESFYEHVNASGGQEFFDVIRVVPDWPVALHRYQGFHLVEHQFKGRYRLEALINFFMGKREFYGGRLIPYGRSAWFTATRDFAAYTLRYINDRPDFVRFLKTIWSPDEFLFNTLVMNSPFHEKVASSNLRYIDWSEGKVNPKIFTVADYTAVTNSDCFLARKFDTGVDTEILSMIDQRINEMRQLLPIS